MPLAITAHHEGAFRSPRCSPSHRCSFAGRAATGRRRNDRQRLGRAAGLARYVGSDLAQRRSDARGEPYALRDDNWPDELQRYVSLSQRLVRRTSEDRLGGPHVLAVLRISCDEERSALPLDLSTRSVAVGAAPARPLPDKSSGTSEPSSASERSRSQPSRSPSQGRRTGAAAGRHVRSSSSVPGSRRDLDVGVTPRWGTLDLRTLSWTRAFERPGRVRRPSFRSCSCSARASWNRATRASVACAVEGRHLDGRDRPFRRWPSRAEFSRGHGQVGLVDAGTAERRRTPRQCRLRPCRQRHRRAPRHRSVQPSLIPETPGGLRAGFRRRRRADFPRFVLGPSQTASTNLLGSECPRDRALGILVAGTAHHRPLHRLGSSTNGKVDDREPGSSAYLGLPGDDQRREARDLGTDDWHLFAEPALPPGRGRPTSSESNSAPFAPAPRSCVSAPVTYSARLCGRSWTTGDVALVMPDVARTCPAPNAPLTRGIADVPRYIISPRLEAEHRLPSTSRRARSGVLDLYQVTDAAGRERARSDPGPRRVPSRPSHSGRGRGAADGHDVHLVARPPTLAPQVATGAPAGVTGKMFARAGRPLDSHARVQRAEDRRGGDRGRARRRPPGRQP